MNSKSKFDNLLKKYSENAKIRASVSAIPYVGGSLDILLTSGIHKKSQERFQGFLNELENQLKKIEENKIDYGYLESEEFYDLFLQTSNLAVRTRLQEKIRAYASILTSSISSGFENKLKAEDVLNIIEGLTENDIILINLISKYLNSENTEKINSDKVFDSGSFSRISEGISEDFIFVGLMRLIKSSLIIKHPVKSAPIPRLSFSTTPMFDIVKEFILE